jgi:hypothetical protein
VACASSPDGRGATPGRAPPRRDRASDRGWRDAAPRRAGWPPSWPSGTRPSSSSVGGSGCGDRGGTTLDSEGICAVGAGPSWCGPRRAPPRRKWQALPREPRPETDAGTAKKEEEINGEAGRKPIKKMAPFQAASFGHFSEGRWHSSVPCCPDAPKGPTRTSEKTPSDGTSVPVLVRATAWSSPPPR